MERSRNENGGAVKGSAGNRTEIEALRHYRSGRGQGPATPSALDTSDIAIHEDCQRGPVRKGQIGKRALPSRGRPPNLFEAETSALSA
ncbi:hypothetical protein SPHINGOAX6_70993 [Sphingomonas sp. AX6]|nr:hypothetical protein SPHINGOAX6_70993 [Sphingomonas sp. AX6]